MKEMGILVAAIHNENLQLGKAHPLLMGFKADLLKYINYLDKSLANIIVSSTSSDRKLILKKLVSNEKSKFSLKMSELNQLIESIEQRQVRNILVVNQTSLLVDVDYPRFLRTSQLSIKEMDAFRVKVAEYRRLAKDYSTTALIALAVAAVGGGYAWFGGKHHKAVDAANQASQIERAQSDAAAQAATEKENASFVINSNIFVKSLKDNYPADLEKFNYLSNAKLTPEVKIAEAKNYLETHAQITPAELTLLIKNLHADDFGRFSKDEKDYYDNIVRALGLREQSQTSSYGPLLVSAIEKTNFKKSNALEIDGIISILTNKEKLLDPKVQVGFTDSDRYVIKNVLLFNYSQRNFTPEQKAAKLSVIPQKVNSNDAFSKIIKSNTSAKLKRWALLAVLDSTDSISVEDYKLIVTSYSKSTELAEDLTDRINEEYRAFANSPNFSINSAYAYESLLMFLVASTKINLTDVSMAEMEKLNAFTTQSTKELVSAGPGSELEKKSSQFLLKRFYEYKRASAIGKEN